jgi:hypothetical protein
MVAAMKEQGVWRILTALQRPWVPHPIGFGSSKDAGFDSAGSLHLHEFLGQPKQKLRYPAASKILTSKVFTNYTNML